MAEIVAIDKGSVHRICSGQVVLSLAVAVKELVENAIDAGATSVDVKLKDSGLERIEVTDNGEGIAPNNYERLTMKHYTSKLTDFSDLTSVATFGFRGEALSSLCALATLTVQTCHGDEQHGTEVTYNHNGGIESKGVCAHKRGTTVRLDGLFAGWPVRHREMKRNLKKEFGKMVQLLQAYCLVRPDVRIACVNVSPKGSKAKVLSSPGRNDLKSVITVLFGGKQLQALSPYTAADAATNAAEPAGSGAGASADGEGGAAAAAAAPRITITGYISKAKPECGRGSGDRQFLSINSRPCDLGKVSKAITEVYHQYVKGRSPVYALNIELPRSEVDINVTPDKRSVFALQETELIATLKAGLHAMWEPSRGQFDLATTQSSLADFGIKPDPKPAPPAAPSRRRSSGGPATAHDSAGTSADPGPADAGANSGATRPNSNPKAPSARSRIGSGGSRSMRGSGAAEADVDGSEDEGENEGEGEEEARPPRRGKGRASRDRVASAETPDQLEGDPDLAEAEEGGSPNETKRRRRESAGPARPAAPRTLQVRSYACSVRGCVKYRIDMGNFTSLKAHYKSKHPRHTAAPTITEVPIASAVPDAPPNAAEGDDSDGWGAAAEADESMDVPPVNSVIESSAPTADGVETHHEAGAMEVEGVEGAAEGGFPDEAASLNDSVETMDLDESPPSLAGTDLLSPIAEAEHPAPPTPTLTFEAPGSASPPPTDQSTDRGDVEASGDAWTATGSTDQGNDVRQEAARAAAAAAAEATPVLSPAEVKRALQSRPKAMQVPFDLGALEARAAAEEAVEEGGSRARFISVLGQTSDAEAEAELQRTIGRDDFVKMEILGQFNLGFIVVRLKDDLFIIDQHASEEKYNFERLQRETVMQSQRLVVPRPLELTAVHESVLLDNIEVFRRNGFDFVVDADAPPTKRVRMTRLPFSKGTVFGPSDIDELIFMLGDAPGVMCRPSRVRAMFASRACRTSVMIGTALDRARMRQIVDHMGTMDQPWNCPHGRPTMRHVFDLARMPAKD